MALGVAAGLGLLYRQARRRGLDANRLIDAAFYITAFPWSERSSSSFSVIFLIILPSEGASLDRPFGRRLSGGTGFRRSLRPVVFPEIQAADLENRRRRRPRPGPGPRFRPHRLFSRRLLLRPGLPPALGGEFPGRLCPFLDRSADPPGPSPRSTLRGGPEFRKRPRSLSAAPAEQDRRPGLFILRDQLCRHPVFHRDVPGRSLRQRLPL